MHNIENEIKLNNKNIEYKLTFFPSSKWFGFSTSVLQFFGQVQCLLFIFYASRSKNDIFFSGS